MANDLIIREVQLPTSQKGRRAAQYVRMSTDRQRYSIQNQAAVIGAYAHAHNLTIVRTYADEGESGLRIKNRAGLRQLIQDVCDGQADFDFILVYDVSRWGRFQDIDESAHYEFVCKQAGKKIAYCAEQFENDGSMLSSIVKNLKRVMAAEYSRELSEKVHAGASRFARMGFLGGGPVGYGLRRQLVNERLQPKSVLKSGDRKYLVTDHVRLLPGTADEIAVVRWVFEQFLSKRSETAIACELNRLAVPSSTGRPWNRSLIGRLLRNENYIGNIVYNRRSRKLRSMNRYNPPELWIRSEGCVEAMVEQKVFLRAKKIIEDRRVDISEEEMLARLLQTLKKEGRHSPSIIDATIGLPCAGSFQLHFGSLRNAYRLIGYTSKRDCEYIDSGPAWDDLAAKLASQVGAGIVKVGGRVAFDRSTLVMHVEGRTNISFRIARWYHGKKPTHAPYWTIQRRAWLPPGWIVAIRLDAHNKAALDYVLLPTPGIVRRSIKFSESVRVRRGIDRFGTSEALVRSIVRRATKQSSNETTVTASRASRRSDPAKLRRSKGPKQSARSRAS